MSAGDWPDSRPHVRWPRPGTRLRSSSADRTSAAALLPTSIPAPARWWTIASTCCWAAALICVNSTIALASRIRCAGTSALRLSSPVAVPASSKRRRLPAPFHTALSFLRYKLLSPRRQAGDCARLAGIAGRSSGRQQRGLPLLVAAKRADAGGDRSILGSGAHQQFERRPGQDLR